MSDLELQVVIAVASALFGVIVAVVLAIEAMRRTKDPSWAIRSNNLLKDHVSNLEGLHISYGNEPVESVTISRIVFGIEARIRSGAMILRSQLA